jgi:hypothetical protein
MIKDQKASLWLNISLGFTGVLCAILVISLVIRLLNPRTENERSAESFLIQNVIQVEVLNGAGAPGLASRFTNTLRKAGFDVVDTGNFENFQVEESYIISRIDDRENARRIANTLNISPENIIVMASTDFFLDATIVVGADWKSLNNN